VRFCEPKLTKEKKCITIFYCPTWNRVELALCCLKVLVFLRRRQAELAGTPERNDKGTILGGQDHKFESKWAENNENQQIYKGQGGHCPLMPIVHPVPVYL